MEKNSPPYFNLELIKKKIKLQLNSLDDEGNNNLVLEEKQNPATNPPPIILENEEPKKPQLTPDEIVSLLNISNTNDFIEATYQLILGRNSDIEGKLHHHKLLSAGKNRAAILYQMVTSQEFLQRGIHIEIPAILNKANQKEQKSEQVIRKLKKIVLFPIVFNWIGEWINLPRILKKQNESLNSQLRIITAHHENTLNKQVDYINTRFDHIDAHLNDLTTQLNSIQHKINELFTHIELIALKNDQATERSINVAHYHYDKCLDLFEEIKEKMENSLLS